MGAADVMFHIIIFFIYSPVIRELLNKEKGWKRGNNDYESLDVRMNRSKVSSIKMAIFENFFVHNYMYIYMA
jgi:hypothetical protein